MSVFDLALCLRMTRSTSGVCHIVFLQILGQLSRDIAGTVVTQQSGFMFHSKLIQSSKAQGLIQYCRQEYQPQTMIVK